MNNPVEISIAAPSIERLIEAAKSGDTAAAKSVLALASVFLKTDIYGPLPRPLALHLSTALGRASLGESSDVTLNLKHRGRPRKDYRIKLQIGHLIYEAMKDGKSLEEASFDCEEHIRAGIEANGNCYGFTRPPDYKRLEAIYREVLPELQSLGRCELQERGR